MPQIGEVKRGKEIGHLSANSHKYIWTACEKCGTERWVALVKGQPLSKNCRLCVLSPYFQKGHKAYQLGKYGIESSSWKGGRSKDGGGYIRVRLCPNDFFYSMATMQGTVAEHRLVMAKHLGRCLHSWEIVHHKGTKHPLGSIENKSDNRLENLQLVSDDRHKQITILERKISFLKRQVLQLKLENIQLRELVK